MDGIRQLSALNINPWWLLILAFAAYIFSTLITTLNFFIFAPLFCFKVKEFRMFGLTLERQNDGKWEKRGGKVTVGFTAECVLDLDKTVGVSDEKLRAKEAGLLLVNSITELIVAGAFALAGVYGGLNIESDFPASTVLWFGIAVLVFSVVRFGVRIWILIKTNASNSLAGYTQNALAKIRADVPFENLDLKPVSEMDYKKIANVEKIMYFPLYFMYLDASGKYDRMAAAVGEIEGIIKPAANSRADAAVLIALVYYYSCHYIMPSTAKEYYHRVGDALEKDRDANGMCIKGFYNLNCFGDINRARECLNQANASIDSFSRGSEREYWRKNIAKLSDAINRFQQ